MGEAGERERERRGRERGRERRKRARGTAPFLDIRNVLASVEIDGHVQARVRLVGDIVLDPRGILQALLPSDGRAGGTKGREVRWMT